MTVQFVDEEEYHIYVRQDWKGWFSLAYNVCRGPKRRKNRDLCIELAIDRKTGQVRIVKQISNDQERVD